MEVPQKTKNRGTIRSSNPTPGPISRQTLIRKDTCTPMFIAALFAIAKTWKQPKCPSTDEQIKKMRYIQTDAGTWINLRKIILESKKPDTKATYDMIPIK